MHAVTVLLAPLTKKSWGTDCEEKQREQKVLPTAQRASRVGKGDNILLAHSRGVLEKTACPENIIERGHTKNIKTL